MNNRDKERILIVDDDENVSKSLALIFNKKGYETETAKTGQNAIEKAKGRFFNIALLDINLPDMEGIELIEPLKNMHPDMDVIMVTGYASVDNAVRALNEGVVAYNTKPLNIDEVLATIENVVEKQHLVFEKQQAEKALKESQERLSSFMESATDTFVLFDSKLNLVEVNKAGLKTWGVNKEDVIGKNLLEISPNINDTGRINKYQEVIKSGNPYSFDDLVPHPKFGDKHLTLKAFRVGDGLGIIINDITERKKAEEKIKASKLRYEKLFTEALTPIFLINPESNVIEEVNPAVVELTGYKKEELVGANLSKIIPEDKKDAEKLIDKVVKEEAFRQTNKIIETKEGENRIADASYSYYVYQDKPLIQIIATDVTERKRAEEERKRLNANLREKNKEMEQIVYATSHDLRSPLINVQGFSKELDASLNNLSFIIKDEKVPIEIREKVMSILNNDISESLQYILTSVSKMDSLLNGLLKLSLLNRTEFKKEKLNMNRIISDIAKTFDFQIKEADVNLDVSELPICKGDETQINQVFSNLLDNGLKYLNPKRSGNIKISGDKKKDRVIYCVEDNGIGISPENQEKIFNIFHKLDPEVYTGEGLGLTIIRKILDKHHGKIWVESEQGEGSKFYISLPIV